MWIRWIKILRKELEESGTRVTFKHVKAHTVDNENGKQQREIPTEVLLNKKADQKAGRVREDSKDPGWLQRPPQPTFMMDKWTIWMKEKRYQEGDIYQWVKRERLDRRKEMTIHNYRLLDQRLYQATTMSEKQRQFWHTKNPRDYSLCVQV